MKWVLDIIANVIDIILITFFIVKWLGCKTNIRKTAVFLIMGTVPSCITIISEIFLDNHIFVIGIYLLFLLLGVILFLNGSLFEKILVTTFSVMLMLIVSTVTLSIVVVVFQNQSQEIIVQQGTMHYFILYATKFFYLIFAFAILRYKNKIAIYLKWKEWIIITSVFLMSLIAEFVLFNAYERAWEEWQPLLLFVTMALAVFNIVIFCLFALLNQEHEKEKQLKVMEVRLKEQSKSLQEINALSLEMRKIRHDINKYLEVASALLCDGKTDKAYAYINELKNTKIDSIFRLITTSSDVVNAVLNLKITACMKKNIMVNYQITGDFEAFSEMDISILIENLFDNAIEAAQQCVNPSIDISISNNKAYLVFVISNSIQKSVLLNNPNLFTSKEDKALHGLGFQTILDIVEKYHGMINLSENNKKDKLTIDIRLKRKITIGA